MSEPDFLTRRWVRFTPQRTDDLRPEAEEWIGKVFEVRHAWLITEEDGGPYVGQHCWTPTDFDVRVGWIPDCDLTDVEPDQLQCVAKVKRLHPEPPVTPDPDLVAESNGWSIRVDRSMIRPGVTYSMAAGISASGERFGSLIAQDGEDASAALILDFDGLSRDE